jgi:hypothetical protein
MSSPAAFNAVFRELVTVVKNETGDKDVKNAIKAQYRVWNAASPDIAKAFHERFADAYPGILAGGFEAVPGDVELLAGKTVADVISSIKDPDFLPRVKACVTALMAISMAAHVSDDAAACDDVMKRTQKELGGVPAGLADVVMDEELVAYVKDAAKALAETGGSCGLPIAESPSGFPEALPDGAIMAIARDISSGIDPEMLSRPDGMQSLVQTVSAGIGERIGKGEIDPNALMAEATEMLKHVDIADAMKMLGGMGGGGLDMSGIDLSALAGMMGKAPNK